MAGYELERDKPRSLQKAAHSRRERSGAVQDATCKADPFARNTLLRGHRARDNLTVDRVIVLVGYPVLTPTIRCSSSYFARYG
jgi:hypothetical protein